MQDVRCYYRPFVVLDYHTCRGLTCPFNVTSIYINFNPSFLRRSPQEFGSLFLLRHFMLLFP